MITRAVGQMLGLEFTAKFVLAVLSRALLIKGDTAAKADREDK